MKHYFKTLLVLLALIVANNKAFNQNVITSAQLWTKEEQALLLQQMENSQQALMKEVEGLTEQQWQFKEISSRWSVAEVVEPLFAQNESYRVEMRTALAQPELMQFAGKTKMNDSVFIKYVIDTLKADAGFLSPIGRFCAKEKALFAFDRTFDALMQMIKTGNKDFRKHFTFRNYVFDGSLSFAEKYNIRDMHQLMLTCFAHTHRHINQIRQIKKHQKFPS